MDRVLDHPSTDPERSPEDMLRDLEDLVDAALLEVDRRGDDARRRFDRELAPLLDDARAAVAQAGIRARNIVEDAVHVFRAFLATSRLPAPERTPA